MFHAWAWGRQIPSATRVTFVKAGLSGITRRRPSSVREVMGGSVMVTIDNVEIVYFIHRPQVGWNSSVG